MKQLLAGIEYRLNCYFVKTNFSKPQDIHTIYSLYVVTHVGEGLNICYQNIWHIDIHSVENIFGHSVYIQ